MISGEYPVNRIALATTALVAAVAAVPASATYINFDTFPNGSTVPVMTAIGTQYASLGVTFTGTNGATSGVPTATDYSAGPVGPNYSGNYLANTAVPVNYNSTILAPRYTVVSMLFSTVVDNVSFSYNNFAGSQFQSTLNAYDASGALLQTMILTGGNGWEVKTLTAAAIARIDILPPTVTNGATLIFGIDQLNFTQQATAAVPEPASWAMMIAGFGLVGGAMRRRKVRTTVSFA